MWGENKRTIVALFSGSPCMYPLNDEWVFCSLDDDDRLGINTCSVRRVSDISHINQLRREISGLSHLASEYYEIKKIDADNISLDRLDALNTFFHKILSNFRQNNKILVSLKIVFIIELSLCATNYPYIFATQCRWP